ncbi:VWA domain-containing protein [Nitrosomonas sp.]|uniref:vWA domain-containing protein n=2 Tax=Nitrosomonas sp. TaxID=42353 RepID=UPI002848FB63|nr:VWA domain-containing protein [Nitrosomonas sp.]MCP5243075.1 VWA domain-containing protein [Burkholderiales bacterium]MDR4513128.1 VWA domain-containing protein [Nitrosomonas sp.]
MKNKLLTATVALGLGINVAMAPMAANADQIQLGFILDESGSIGAGNWNIIRQGLANGIDLIPVGGADTYEVSIVSFSSGATVRASNVLIDSVAARDALSDAVENYNYNGGSTNFAAAYSTMRNVLNNTIGNADFSYVNFATDGQQNVGGTGVAERNSLIAAGVDNISIEGIGGGVDANDLRNNFCYPQPCDTTVPYNFPTQGFYIGVANAQGYADAITNKIRVVTGQVPEPGTVALLSVALLGMGIMRRRKED